MPKVFNRAIKLAGQLVTLHGVSVRVLEYDQDGKITRASGLTLPTGAGYSKGCLFFKTNASTKAVYENVGTTASADFILLGDDDPSTVAIDHNEILVGNSDNEGASVPLSGDATIDDTGAMTIASSVIKTAKVSLTNANIKALRATPISLVTAPGSGKVVQFVSALLKLQYAGTNVFTESTANLGVKYNNGAGVQVSEDIESTGFIDQSAKTQTQTVAKKDAIVASASAENKALVLHNLGAGEIGGNAGNDNTLDVYVTYRVITIA